MTALTMELSNILEAIGADDVKVCDWSTAEPMLDVIPIALYRCRLCHDSSLKKTMMVQHLSACHENEWKVASIRVKELMHVNESNRGGEPDLHDLCSTEDVTGGNLSGTRSENSEAASDSFSAEYTPRIGRLPTRINHPLFLLSSLPPERKAPDAKTSNVEALEVPSPDVNVANEGVNALACEDTLSTTEQHTLAGAINMAGPVQQTRLPWADNWAMQARLNFARFNQTAQSQPVSPPKLYLCLHCPSRFTTKKALQKHQDIHNGVLVRCDLCDFTSVWSTSIKKHKQLKHFRENLPLLNCPQCDFKTKNSDNMRRHRRKSHCRDALSVQLVRKTPSCPVIPVRKRYTCDHCCKTFTTKRAMKKHQDIHNGTLVKCDLCDFTSVWSASIKKHKLLRHFRDDLPVLYCPQCDFKTKNSDNLRRHRRIIHGRDNLFTNYSNHLIVPPAPENEHAKNDESQLHVFMGSGHSEGIIGTAVLKSPKREQSEVYITSEAPVNHYFDVVSEQNDDLRKVYPVP